MLTATAPNAKAPLKGTVNTINNTKSEEKPAFADVVLELAEETAENLKSLRPIEHKEVLRKLLDELQRADFVSLVHPDVTDPDEELRQTLQKGIKQKHYVVCIISEILKIAKRKNWNLCRCFDYVYVYNGAFWKQLGKEDLKFFLGEAAIRLGYPEIEAAHHLFKDELLKQFLTQAHLPTPERDSGRILINLQNGTWELINKEWRLRPYDPKDFLTYVLPFSYVPGAACPIFDGYLNKVLPDKDSQKILQEFAGFIFTDLNLEKCLVLTGSGSNGKSVCFNVLTALYGKENTLTYSMGLFNHEYNRAKLTNVLLNYSSEKGHDLNVETFKALVSGEPLQAREPYGKSFTLYNKVKFILNCNELPKETESTEAYFRRYIIIPFEVKISESERDIHLADKIIKQELSGVFNWLLEGLTRLVQTNRFTESLKVNHALSEFKRQADNVALFVEEMNYAPHPTSKKPLSDLYAQYKSFCQDDGYKHLGKNKFSAKMESKGFESTRLNDGSKAFHIEQVKQGKVSV